jgi:hypothetical protein
MVFKNQPAVTGFIFTGFVGLMLYRIIVGIIDAIRG